MLWDLNLGLSASLAALLCKALRLLFDSLKCQMEGVETNEQEPSMAILKEADNQGDSSTRQVVEAGSGWLYSKWNF